MSSPTPRPDGLTLDLVAWDDLDTARLRVAQQAELRDRYGDDDLGHLMTGEKVVVMVLVRMHGEPVACGAVRDAGDELGAGVGELKRMYVIPGMRGRGLSRVVLTELEVRARALGYSRLVLETGVLQPEAMGLYLASGYTVTENFGVYSGVVESRCFAKELRAGDDGPAGQRRSGESGVEVTLRAVGWDDPDAARLRREMYEVANKPRYPELVAYLERIGGFEVDDARTGVGTLTTLVADVGPTAVGCVTLRPAPRGLPEHLGELKKVFVSESARGLGVARHLLGAIEVDARSRGLTGLVLHTGIRQPEAISLYTSLGYRPVRLFPQHVGDPIALCFGKDLH